MYKTHTYCRACHYARGAAPGTKSAANEKLIPVFDLGIQPLANDFAGEGDPRAGHAPLKVLYCPRCTLAQLSVVVDPKILYSHYLYVTSPSDTMKRHFDQLTGELVNLKPFRSVLEIGSNDGAYLEYLRPLDVTVCGIDPAANLAHVAREKGIPTVTGIFERATAEAALSVQKGGFDLIVARHVFCHVDDWHSFMDALTIPSHRDTIVALEVPYVADLLERGEFDTIYHEHLSYLSLKSIDALLQDSAWRLERISRFAIHGGAIVLILSRKDSRREQCETSRKMVDAEMITLDTWRHFNDKAQENLSALNSFVREERSKGKRIAGIGASAKSTVWINACGFTRGEISFITDTTPQKQWRFSPGTDIPITDEGAILRDLPDYVVVFCWNYASEVIAKSQAYIKQGGKLIMPVPSLEVIEESSTKEKVECCRECIPSL